MESKNEIGGFMDLSLQGSSPRVIKEVQGVNTGRNALKIILRQLKLHVLQLPYYTCPVVWEAAQQEKVKIIPYDVDDDFYPINCDPDQPLLYTNYYGICGKKIKSLNEKFKILIIDNSQALYSSNFNRPAFWSLRKFIGTPDGGLFWPFYDTYSDLPKGTSWERCQFLFKRIDLGASNAYSDFKVNEQYLNELPVEQISNLSSYIYKNYDHDAAIERRIANFQFLHENLEKNNIMKIELDADDVPMIYPYRTKRKSLRTKFIDNKVYTPIFWPKSQSSACMSSQKSVLLASEIIPLPIDQRYSLLDMTKIVEIANE